MFVVAISSRYLHLYGVHLMYGLLLLSHLCFHWTWIICKCLIIKCSCIMQPKPVKKNYLNYFVRIWEISVNKFQWFQRFVKVFHFLPMSRIVHVDWTGNALISNYFSLHVLISITLQIYAWIIKTPNLNKAMTFPEMKKKICSQKYLEEQLFYWKHFPCFNHHANIGIGFFFIKMAWSYARKYLTLHSS